RDRRRGHGRREVRPARLARGLRVEGRGWPQPAVPHTGPRLTHHLRPSIAMEAGTTFHVSDSSPAEALEKDYEVAATSSPRGGRAGHHGSARRLRAVGTRGSYSMGTSGGGRCRPMTYADPGPRPQRRAPRTKARRARSWARVRSSRTAGRCGVPTENWKPA